MNGLINQHPYLPSLGDPADLNVPLASWRYPGMIGSKFVFAGKAYLICVTHGTLAVATSVGAPAVIDDAATYVVTTAVTNAGRAGGVFLAANLGVTSVVAIQIGGLATVHYVDAPTSAPDATGKNVIISGTGGRADSVVTAPTRCGGVMGHTVAASSGGAGVHKGLALLNCIGNWY